MIKTNFLFFRLFLIIDSYMTQVVQQKSRWTVRTVQLENLGVQLEDLAPVGIATKPKGLVYGTKLA